MLWKFDHPVDPDPAILMIRLGVIDVLNVLPVYYPIIKGMQACNAQLVFGRVTELNRKLNEGDLDISVVSSFEYARNPDLYKVLPDLSVSADGPVRSIYLFSQKPLHELDKDRIKLTAHSLTSVHLIRYLLAGRDLEFTTAGTATAELLIADEAIQRYYEKKDPFVYDLSALWKEKTGLPFVFALWAVRREVWEQRPDEVTQVAKALVLAKEKSKLLYATMAAESYRNIFPDKGLCEDYLRNLVYEFSPHFQKGFALFIDKMSEMGLLKRRVQLDFLPGFAP